MTNQIFISYRHVAPDEDLARSLTEFLRTKGFRVFIDRDIPLGSEWGKEIDRGLRSSAFFIVLLSKQSILSDPVCQEVRIAHRLWRTKKLQILPIRIDFDGDLPYEFGFCLDRIQYKKWQSDEPRELICRDVLEAIEGAVESWQVFPPTTGDLPAITAEDATPNFGRAPLPAADPRPIMVDGKLQLNTPYYVKRDTDARMEHLLNSEGATLIIQGARQLGKTSLLARGLSLTRSQNKKSVYIDFRQLDERHLINLPTLLRYLAMHISRALNLGLELETQWDDRDDEISFATFLEASVLEPANTPILLCLDDVDRIFVCRYRDSFFATIRAWHNERANRPLWNRLNLAIAHANSPDLWINDLNASPFNVGERVRLKDFTRAEIEYLNTCYGTPLNTSDIKDLQLLIGGQPYLARRAFYVISQHRWTVTELCRVATEVNGPFSDHLRGQLRILHRNQRLRSAMKRVVNQGDCRDEMDYQQLWAAGLIAGNDRLSPRPRYGLYRQYFRRHL